MVTVNNRRRIMLAPRLPPPSPRVASPLDVSSGSRFSCLGSDSSGSFF
jgi:hypothetical protein